MRSSGKMKKKVVITSRSLNNILDIVLLSGESST